MLRLFSISFVLPVVLKLFSASQFSIYLKIPHLQALTSVAGPPFKRAKSQWELYQCFFSDVSRQIFSHLHDSVMLPLRNLGFAVTFLLLFFFSSARVQIQDSALGRQMSTLRQPTLLPAPKHSLLPLMLDVLLLVCVSPFLMDFLNWEEPSSFGKKVQERSVF
jgi:hypothetical protein